MMKRARYLVVALSMFGTAIFASVAAAQPAGAAGEVSPQIGGGPYASHETARKFIAEMTAKHGFSEAQLQQVLGRTQHLQKVIDLIRPSASPSARSWQRYRGNLVSAPRIVAGTLFWQEHYGALERASRQYGVPAEIIVAIIGIESNYGRHAGNFETVSALATLAFDYPPRAQLFTQELESLLLLAREQGRDPFSYSGSYAGAIGYPQFLPSSIRSYAVDFDGDGLIDLETSPEDAIGSVANYLASHGWQAGQPIAARAHVRADTDITALSGAGIEPTLTPVQLTAAGVTTAQGQPSAAATFVDLSTPDRETEYWLGYRNFYVITRYNKSSFYAMAVTQLGEALRDARG